MMKKIVNGALLSLIAGFMFFALNLCAYASEYVNINATNFPDENFRDYVKSMSNKYISTSTSDQSETVAHVTNSSRFGGINVDSDSISSLKGIEFFSVCQSLDCNNNSISTLDLSANTALDSLICYKNSLTDLNVNNCTLLTYLDCKYNKLTSLSVNSCSVLDELSCSHNAISSLGMSGCSSLTTLYAGYNQLSSLDITSDTSLTYLHVNDNLLTTLNTSSNTSLLEIDCTRNNLGGIDVSKNTNLEILKCSNNKLTSLDVSGNTNLRTLQCSNNNLACLDLSNNSSLTKVLCTGNSLTVKTTNGLFDLSTISGFDISKASNWSGGTVNGNILTFTSDEATYTYDLGKSFTATFTLVRGDKDISEFTYNQAKYKITSVSTYDSSTGTVGTVEYIQPQKKAKKVSIPEKVYDTNGNAYTVTSISSKAFTNNTKIKTLIIPATVTTINTKAFYKCENLKTIKIYADSLNTVKAKAFKGLNKSLKITIFVKNKNVYKKVVKKLKKAGATNAAFTYKKKN